MRRYQKKELLDSIASLEEINQIIVHHSSPTVPVTAQILGECQELAIAVGSALETYGEQGKEIAGILEVYCENIYQMSLVLTDADKCRKLAKKILKQLRIVDNKIKYDLPKDKKEIIFLPYKASMWDSLESVWKAASEDENCNTFVIPIPYFDRNADGSLGQMHYEGEQYPAYVPITSWQEYNIPERRPDVIYIHNPYDQCNYVTSVHPAFYASELHKYTDMLVYISYFVAIHDKMKGQFCTAPGVFYADRVIVQSEAVREIYIKELGEYEEKYNCQGEYGDIEEKILALGNPKYDKAVWAEKEIHDLPKEWERLILLPDGRKKKVILYNTTVDEMLKHSDRILAKIKEVLALFQKKRDAVLLWRPHPLFLATMESMCPQLVGEYRDIVAKYKQDGFGIFDDLAELYRAIAVSDAYYGDMSSVVELYRQTGKPILIESFFPHDQVELQFEAFVQVDEVTAYASNALCNGLFKVNINTGECAYMGMFPGEEAGGIRLHAKAVYADGKVYFVPASAAHLSIYDITTGEFEIISIAPWEGNGTFYKPGYKFADAVLWGEYLFIIGATYPAVLRMELKTGKMEYYTDWVPEEGVFFKKGAAVNGSVFYIPNSKDNIVLEFHMDSCESRLHHIGVHNNGSWSICRAGEDYWLIPQKEGAITRWNPANGMVAEYSGYPKGFEGGGFLFTKAYQQGGQIRLLPAYANMSVQISLDTGEITKNMSIGMQDELLTGFLFESEAYYYLLRSKRDKNVYTSDSAEVYRLNTFDNSLERYRFTFQEGREKFALEHKGVLYQLKMGRNVYKEQALFGIENFLDSFLENTVSGTGAREVSLVQDGSDPALKAKDSTVLASIASDSALPAPTANISSTIGEKIHKRILDIVC